MRKRIGRCLGLALCLALLAAVLLSQALAASGDLSEGDLFYTVNGNAVTITGCAEGVTSLTIPAEIDGKPVTAIANRAFENRASLTELVLPEGVTSLGYYMLQGASVTELTVPSTVTQSGYYNSDGALAGCVPLRKVIFAEGTKTIPAYICASQNQTSYLQEIVIPDSVSSIGDHAFYYCVNLAGELRIPGSVASIGDNAFRNCPALTSLVIEEGKQTLVNGIVTDSVTQTLNGEAFRDCAGLKTVDLAKSVKTIKDGVFRGCSALESVTFHENDGAGWAMTIGDRSFQDCKSLTALALPEGVTSLGYYMLQGASVTELTVPSTVTQSGYYNSNGALAGCVPLRKVIFAEGTKTIPAYICASEGQTSYIQEVVFPEGLERIGNSAFYRCANLAVPYLIPESVHTIGDNAFAYCMNTLSVRFPIALQNLSNTAFRGTSIGEARISTEDAPVAISLINNEIHYVADMSGIKDGPDKYLDRTKCDVRSSSSTVSAVGMIPLTIQYAFKSTSNPSNLSILIKLPAGTSVLENTITVNGQETDTTITNDGRLTCRPNAPAGTISLMISPQSTRYMMIYAQAIYSLGGRQRTETIGIIDLSDEVLTLFVPNEISTPSFVAAGTAGPGRTVELLVGDELVATATASATGNYSAEITLAAPEEGKSYRVRARWIGADGSETSCADLVTYRSNAAELTEFMMYYRGKQYDILSLGATSPVISWSNGTSFTFTVDFDDCSKVEEVRIVSSKKNGDTILPAVYDQAQDRFVATGFKGYVPGTIYVEYREKQKPRFEGASVRPDGRYTESGLAGRSFWFDRTGEASDFRFITELQENAAFEPQSEGYIQGVYEGKTCYMSEGIVRYEREGEIFLCRELYLREEDGSYTLLRTGYGPWEEDGGQEAAVLMNDLQDLWESYEGLNTILEDDGVENDKAIYGALYDYIDDAKKYVDKSSPEYTELVSIEYELRTSELMHDSVFAMMETHSVAKKSIKAADDPVYLMPDQMEEHMDECFNSMTGLAKRTEDETLRNVLNKLSQKNGKDKSLMERLNEMMVDDYKRSKAKFRGKMAVDPSGFVYEAVESNRLEGVTATIFYRETMEAAPVVWDASEYDQLNPLLTDEAGCYAWDVPEGFWQVMFEKEGYETAYSEWLPVPPPQLEVNVGMVSAQAPAVKLLNAHGGSIELVFTQYVDVSTVTGDTVVFTAEGRAVAGTWEALDAEAAPGGEGQTLASAFRFTPAAELTVTTLSCSVENVLGYNGLAVEKTALSDVPVTLDIRSLEAPEELTVAYGGTGTLRVTASPAAAAAGKRLILTSSDAFILSVDAAVTFDASGVAVVKLGGLLPGTATLRYEVEGTLLNGSVAVTVDPEAEPEPEPDDPRDVNGDGVFDRADAAAIFAYTAGWDVPVNEPALDVNGDGKVTNRDALLAFRRAAGLVETTA